MAIHQRIDFIKAYTWIFDCTKLAAAAVYREEKAKKNYAYIESVIAAFKSNAARCFYTD